MKRVKNILYLQYKDEVFPVDLEKHSPVLIIKHVLDGELEVFFTGEITHKEDKCTPAQLINLGLLGCEAEFMPPITDKNGNKYWITGNCKMELMAPLCKYHTRAFAGVAIKIKGLQIEILLPAEELDKWKVKCPEAMKELDLTRKTDMVRLTYEKAMPLSDILSVTLSRVDGAPQSEGGRRAWSFECMLAFIGGDRVMLDNSENEIAELWESIYPELTMTYATSSTYTYVRWDCINRKLLKSGAGTIAGGISKVPLLNPRNGKQLPLGGPEEVQRNLPKEQILDAADKKLLVSEKMVFAEFDINDNVARRITAGWQAITYANQNGIDPSALLIADANFDSLRNKPLVVPLPMPYSQLRNIYGGKTLGRGFSLQTEKLCWPILLRMMRSGEYETDTKLIFSSPAYPGRLYAASAPNSVLPQKTLLKLGGKRIPRLDEDPELGLLELLGSKPEYRAEDTAAIVIDMYYGIVLYMKTGKCCVLKTENSRVFAYKLKDYLAKTCGVFMVCGSQGEEIWANCRHYSEARTKLLRAGAKRSMISFRGCWEIENMVNSDELDLAATIARSKKCG